MSLYDPELHRQNEHHQSAVVGVHGHLFCVHCFLNAVTGDSCFSAAKTHTVRQVLGMIHTGPDAALRSLMERNEVLLANGLTTALAGDSNPSFSVATMSLCQKICQGLSSTSEIFLERVLAVLETQLNPLHPQDTSFNLSGVLQLLYWLLSDSCTAAEGCLDAQTVRNVLQNLVIFLECNADDQNIEIIIRILSRVYLFPQMSKMSVPLQVAIVANITRLMTSGCRSIQALCLDLLLNVKESGLFETVFNQPVTQSTEDITLYLMQLCKGLKTPLLSCVQEHQMKACELVSNLTSVASDSTLRELVAEELCEHLIECLRCAKLWTSSTMRESMQLCVLEALRNISAAGRSFEDHFQCGRVLLIDITSISISSGNQRLLTLALDLLRRSFASKMKLDPADLMDTQDIVAEITDVFCEYEDHPTKISFPFQKRTSLCLACDILVHICSGVKSFWGKVNIGLREILSRSMTTLSAMLEESLVHCFPVFSKFFLSYTTAAFNSTDGSEDELSRDFECLIFMLDVHLVPALICLNENKKSCGDGAANIFESISLLLSKNGGECSTLEKPEVIEAFLSKLIKYQWIPFSINVSRTMDKGPKQEHVARFAWDMLMRMMDILQPKLSTKLPQDNVSEGFHSTFQQYEEFFLHNFNSLSSLIGAIGAVPEDCLPEPVWETCVRVLHVCMVCSGATVDNDFLLQALQRTLTHRHNSLHRSKVLFNLLEIYVEAEAHQRGFEMNMSKISQYWSSILSRCSIIPLTPRCTGSLWILNHGSSPAIKVLDHWIKNSGEGNQWNWMEMGSILRKTPRGVDILLEYINSCQSDSKLFLDTLKIIKMMASSSHEFANELMSRGLWPILRGNFSHEESSCKEVEEQVTLMVECLVPCVAASTNTKEQADHLQSILRSTMNMISSHKWSREQGKSIALLNLVNVFIHAGLSINPLNWSNVQNNVAALLDILKESEDFNEAMKLNNKKEFTLKNQNVLNTQSLVLPALQYSFLSTRFRKRAKINSKPTVDPGIFVFCSLHLQGAGKILALNCLQEHILWNLENHQCWDEGRLSKEITAVIQNNLYDALPCARHAALQALVVLLEMLVQNAGLESVAFRLKTVSWYTIILKDMLQEMSFGNHIHRDVCLYADQNFHDPEETMAQEDEKNRPGWGWDTILCSRCILCALKTPWRACIEECLSNEIDNNRFPQHLLKTRGHIRPEIAHFLSTLVESGIMDRGLSRLKDILQDITEHQQSSEQDREIADTTLVPYDRTPEACEGVKWSLEGGVFVYTCTYNDSPYVESNGKHALERIQSAVNKRMQQIGSMLT